jgi:hypothetical protein
MKGMFCSFRQDPTKRLLDNKRQKQDNVAASDKFCISAKRTIYKNRVLSALCSIPFSNAVGEKYNFPQSPQWFL